MTDKPLWKKCFENIGLAFDNIKHINKETDYVIIENYDLTELRLKSGIFTPFYYIKDIHGFENSREFLELRSRSKLSFIIFGDIKPSYKIISPVVFLNEKNLINETDTSSKIKELILKELQEQCSVEILSPYETDAAVFGDQFFGRKTEINKIITHDATNFTIFGSRRMGKTSLLKQLQYTYNHKIFSSKLGQPNSGEAIFLSCLGVRTLNAFQELLISVLAPTAYWKGDIMEKMRRKKESSEIFFKNYFKQFSGKYKRGIILLLDEVDEMFESSECAEILKHQRLLKDVGYRFIQTGYRAVWNEMQNRDSDFWNFSRALPMSQFNKDDSLELIEIPMDNMGIILKEGVAQRIYEETGGIPNYIQHYCSVIVSVAVDYQKKINNDVFGLIDGDLNFDRIVMNSFHQNVRKPFEKLILYIATFQGLRRFSIRQILDSCEKWNLDSVAFDDINRSMNVLKMLGFVQPAGENLYRVIAPILTKSLRKRDIEKNLTETIKAVKMEQSSKDD